MSDWTDLLSRRRILTLQGLPDLEILELGPEDGRPVMFLHGTPGSCAEAIGLAEVAQAKALRIVAPNRPGCGRSAPWPGRTLTDEALAMGTLADALGWRTFGVMGISGGGPRALAAARFLGRRLDFVLDLAGWAPADTPALRASMAPIDRLFSSIATTLPWLLLPPMALVGWTARQDHPRYLLRFMDSYLSPSDRAAIRDPRLLSLLQTDVRLAYSQGARGPTADALLCFRPWSFDPADIDIPVTFLHGDDDRFVPLAFSQALQATVPGSRLEIVRGAGHYGMFLAMPSLL